MEEKTGGRQIILTGDRPTGRLHLGHYVGSLRRRVELQNSGRFDEVNILIADDQALTDNADDPGKIRDNIVNVALDYLSAGIDPDRATICVQSALPALHALTFYYMNLVTTARVSRNPTVKAEMQLRGFADEGLPVGFFVYPVSQAADITAFDATVVPVGEDQLPMIEQTREIVEKFNRIYGETLVLPTALIPENETQRRLPGVDGKAKMSKSLGNCIYLSDDAKTVKRQVNGRMFTDPQHLRIEDPGHIEGNVVFAYLDALCCDGMFAEYLPAYANLEEMKDHYRRGGLGDGTCKKFLIQVLEETLAPIRAARARWEADIDSVYDILRARTDGRDACARAAGHADRLFCRPPHRGRVGGAAAPPARGVSRRAYLCAARCAKSHSLLRMPQHTASSNAPFLRMYSRSTPSRRMPHFSITRPEAGLEPKCLAPTRFSSSVVNANASSAPSASVA